MPPVSSDVAAGDTVLATQYNNVRDDILDISTGHKHTGAADASPLLFVYDTFANRPAASQIGRLFYASDTKALYRDNGATWDAVLPGMSKAGQNNTEQTTVSLVAVSLLSIGSLSIPVTSGILIMHGWRKTSGAAAAVNFGLMLNATTVQGPDSSMASNVDEAQNGMIVYYIGPQVANYLRMGMKLYSGKYAANTGITMLTADLPNAAITDVIVRAYTDNALVTAGADELRVWELP